MELVRTDQKGAQIEFSSDEIALLTSIIYTVDHQFAALDTTIFDLDEDTIAEFADKFLELKELIRKAHTSSAEE